MLSARGGVSVTRCDPRRSARDSTACFRRMSVKSRVKDTHIPLLVRLLIAASTSTRSRQMKMRRGMQLPEKSLLWAEEKNPLLGVWHQPTFPSSSLNSSASACSSPSRTWPIKATSLSSRSAISLRHIDRSFVAGLITRHRNTNLPSGRGEPDKIAGSVCFDHNCQSAPIVHSLRTK